MRPPLRIAADTVAALLLLTNSSASAADPSAPAGSYRAPVAGPVRVLRGFDPPPNPYQAGHRGVDLAATAGTPVLAAGSGTVRFAGQVAGRGVLVLSHPDGISTEYEPVTVSVVAGQQVWLGEVIATVTGHHRGCPPSACLHWGARRGGSYLDPLLLLRPLGIVRLLPWNLQMPYLRRAGEPG